MVNSSNKSIGILGGSFDPAHRGHLAITKIALKKIKLNKIFWIVNKKNPLKNKAYFSLEKRMYLAKKITKNYKNIKVIYLDKMVKSSRSIDIINFLVKKKKFINIHFIIGSDILMELHRWKSWKKL